MKHYYVLQNVLNGRLAREQDRTVPHFEYESQADNYRTRRLKDFLGQKWRIKRVKK